MNAIILSIGDELVLGQTVDTNSAWISRQLAAVGCAVGAHITVADDQRAIEQAIRESAERCDHLIISGGIGPTADDLTRQALAVVLEQPLEMNETWLTKLNEFFVARGRPMPETNKIQAMIPRGVRMIENTTGTAAGMEAVIEVRYDRTRPPRKCRVFVVPGVPKEMKIMFERDVLPHVRAGGGGGVILSRTLHTFGLGESTVAEKLGPLMKRDRNPTVGTTVSGGVVSVRVNARFESLERAGDELAKTVAACEVALGDVVYGMDDDTLAGVVAKMLIEHPKRPTVTTAESCTGGLLAKMLTDTPGSSAYFNVGFVTYANQAKYERLGVSMEVINTYGAVSEPVAQAMANNARRLARADYALAVSGVAGPTGGSATKPVGTVCVALAHADPDAPRDHARSKTLVRTFNFPGDREMIRDRSAKMTLSMLRYHLLARPMPF
ncbi:MAG: competence/damage-inducible protein A [Tepidisphaeraceae bacterium]